MRISHAPEDLPELLRAKRELLPTLFIVSRVDLERSSPAARVTYESQEIPGLVDRRRPGARREVRAVLDAQRARGPGLRHPTLCERCVPVVVGRGSAG